MNGPTMKDTLADHVSELSDVTSAWLGARTVSGTTRGRVLRRTVTSVFVASLMGSLGAAMLADWVPDAVASLVVWATEDWPALTPPERGWALALLASVCVPMACALAYCVKAVTRAASDLRREDPS